MRSGGTLRGAAGSLQADAHARSIGDSLLESCVYILPGPHQEDRAASKHRENEGTAYSDAVGHILRSIEATEGYASYGCAQL